MNRMNLLAVAALLLGVAACDRKPVDTTTTTGASTSTTTGSDMARDGGSMGNTGSMGHTGSMGNTGTGTGTGSMGTGSTDPSGAGTTGTTGTTMGGGSMGTATPGDMARDAGSRLMNRDGGINR